MKIISLLLALTLFMSVYLEEKPEQKDEPGIFSSSLVTETTENFPVISYFNEKQFVVSGIPQVVNVTLSGPASAVKTTKLQNNFEIYVDLRELGVGTHNVNLQYKDIPDNVNVDIQPKEATVVIQEKMAKEFPVDVDLIREDMIKDGYTAEKAIVKPKVVNVIGAKDVVEKILFVEARVDLQNANDTIEQESEVVAYDARGNALDVEIDPAVVTVEVPITSPSKKVPVKLNQKGALKEGLSIVSIEPIPEEVTIFGPKSIIDGINEIDGLSINLDQIDKDTELEVTVPKPDGVKKVTPEKIKVKIDVDKEIKRTITELPITVFGLKDGLEYQITEPTDSLASLDIFGAQNVINHVKLSDLKVLLNAANLDIGEHVVELEIIVPQNVSWKMKNDKAKIIVSQKTN